MFDILASDEFEAWLARLRDTSVKARLLRRIGRLRSGNFGDHKRFSGGIIELREDVGPGYRIYCKRQGRTVILLLNGGDKSTQRRDIELAKVIAERWEA
jgi:putative addiction module killer protein